MNSSPDLIDGVLRGPGAGALSTATFRTDFTGRANLPPELVAEARAQARATGYAAGWAQGREEGRLAAAAEARELAAAAALAESARAAEAARVLGALAQAAARLEQRTAPAATELEDLIVAAAFRLAEEILGRELAHTPEPGRDALARALGLAPAGLPVTVRLSPADRAALDPDGAGALEVDGRTVTLVTDPNLKAGDATADSEATAIDARLETAVQRAKEALGL
ncbi:FliH/SctL family protein [Spirillospora albida]|uniref:FliH/SctL family protein n=1 Tax=Spirillospora albida TaxID=58123 RepID=UPI0004BE9DBB|nr:FliH/SctL family protein [Spirillospora albida]